MERSTLLLDQPLGDDIFKVSFDFDQLKHLLSTLISQVKEQDGRLKTLEETSKTLL
jgi:hypothetical protein